MWFLCVYVCFLVLEVRSESLGDLHETERSLILIESQSRVVKLCPAGKRAHASEEDEVLADIVRGIQKAARVTPISAVSQHDDVTQVQLLPLFPPNTHTHTHTRCAAILTHTITHAQASCSANQVLRLHL